MGRLRRFVKLEQGIVPRARFDRYVPAHIAYVKRLRRQGRMIESGYWATRGGPPRPSRMAGLPRPQPYASRGRGGMMIFEARNLREARAIVTQDPFVAHRLVTYELREWKLVASRPQDRRKS